MTSKWSRRVEKEKIKFVSIQVKIFPSRRLYGNCSPSDDDDAARNEDKKSPSWHWTGAFLSMTQREIFRKLKKTEKLKSFTVISRTTWKITLMWFFLIFFREKTTRQIHKSCSIFIKTLTTADDIKDPSQQWHVLLPRRRKKMKNYSFFFRRLVFFARVSWTMKSEEWKNHAINYDKNKRKINEKDITGDFSHTWIIKKQICCHWAWGGLVRRGGLGRRRGETGWNDERVINEMCLALDTRKTFFRKSLMSSYSHTCQSWRQIAVREHTRVAKIYGRTWKVFFTIVKLIFAFVSDTPRAMT